MTTLKSIIAGAVLLAGCGAQPGANEQAHATDLEHQMGPPTGVVGTAYLSCMDGTTARYRIDGAQLVPVRPTMHFSADASRYLCQTGRSREQLGFRLDYAAHHLTRNMARQVTAWDLGEVDVVSGRLAFTPRTGHVVVHGDTTMYQPMP